MNALKSGLKWLAEQLFGEFFEEILKNIFGESVLAWIGYMFFGSIAILCVWVLIKHFKTPKCIHKRRGVCYQCDPMEPY
jgi:uncharacterized membrane protein YuzA (DUF378 family)